MPVIHIPTVARDPDDISDFLARLPDCAQLKIEAIRKADLEHEGKLTAKYAETTRLREERDNVLREIGHFDRQPRNHTEDQQARRARMVERLARIKANLAKVADAKIESHGISMDKVSEWAASLPPYAQFEPCEVEPCEDNNPMAELTRIRRERADLIDERDRTNYAPLPLDVAKRKAHAEIDSLVKQGRPNVSGLFHLAEHERTGQRTQGDLYWPTTYIEHHKTPDVLALFAWLFEDQMRKRIDALLKEKDRPLDSLTVEERTAQFRVLESRLEAIEYSEEVALQACIAARYDVKRRGDAKVEAVLGIRRISDAERPEPKQVPVAPLDPKARVIN